MNNNNNPTIKKICPNCHRQFDGDIHFCINCGSVLKTPAEISEKVINCEFEYKCPLNWNALRKQKNENVRFCSTCQKNVYFVHSQNELDELAGAGKCVAFHPNGENDPFKEIPPPLMGVIAPPPDFRPPPPPPLERIPTMGMPLSPKSKRISTMEKHSSPKKKNWWEFWK